MRLTTIQNLSRTADGRGTAAQQPGAARAAADRRGAVSDVVAGLLYLNANVRSTQAPVATAPIAIMSGPYWATYDFLNPSIGRALVLDYSSYSTSLRIYST